MECQEEVCCEEKFARQVLWLGFFSCFFLYDPTKWGLHGGTVRAVLGHLFVEGFHSLRRQIISSNQPDASEHFILFYHVSFLRIFFSRANAFQSAGFEKKRRGFTVAVLGVGRPIKGERR